MDENSFVFCASEIFRFLRDMAVDVLAGSQSTSLLHTGRDNEGEGLHKREKNFYGAPPITNKKTRSTGMHSQHLIHPGAVLCMIDLLPAVAVSEEMFHPECDNSGRGTYPIADGRGMSPLSTDTLSGSSKLDGMGVSRSSLDKSPSGKSEDSFHDAQEEQVDMAEEVWSGEGPGGLVVEPAQVEVVEVIVEGAELDAECNEGDRTKQVRRFIFSLCVC